MAKTFKVFMVALLLATPLGCGEDGPERDSGPGGDAKVADAGGPKLTGKISDKKGVAVESAKVELGSLSAFTGTDGVYTIDDATEGAGKVKVSQDWFNEKKDIDVTVKSEGSTTLDITIEAFALKVDSADKTLADSYNTTFDWTKDKLSIVVLSSPTRRYLDNAIYYKNPAMYRDTSSESPVDSRLKLSGLKGSMTGKCQKNSECTAPASCLGEACVTNFVITSGTNKGQDAFDSTKVYNDASGAGLSSSSDFIIYAPMMNWLLNWDSSTTKVADLNAVKSAVEQQTWGSDAVAPQRLEKVFIHNNEIWVKVVFEKFTKVGTSITDKDGDGYKEIYAKVNSKLYTSEIVTALTDKYIKPTYDTHGMSKEINESLNELYTKTAAEIEKYIGQSYTLPGGKGTINYPFAVLKHSIKGGSAYNVLLVGP